MKETFSGRVDEAWIDLNHHMNMGYYLVVFDLATAEFYHQLNIGGASHLEHGHTIFSIETRINYRKELRLAEPFTVQSQLLGFDHNKVHYLHTMLKAGSREVVALNECMAINVDEKTRQSTNFNQASTKGLLAAKATDRHLEIDPWVGQGMRQVGWPDTINTSINTP